VVTDQPGTLRLSRKRKLLYSAVLCAAASTVVFVAGEVYIRRWSPLGDGGWHELSDDPILFYRLAPNVSGNDEGYHRTQTSQRLRGPWVFEKRPPAGVRRILWAGDSACFGCGCDDDQTAPYYLRQVAADSGQNVESINLAVAGYNIRQVREVLAQRSLEFQGADTVVYYHHENDIVNAPLVPLAFRLPKELFWEYEAPQSLPKKLLKRSAVVRRLWNTDLAVHLRRTTEPIALRADERRRLVDRSLALPIHPFTRTCAGLYNEENEYGRRFRDELFALADLVSGMKARFFLVYWPSRTLLHHGELSDLRRVLAHWCEQRKITFLDVTDSFLASDAADLYADTIHPGPEGQRIIAETVLRACHDR